MLGCQCVNQTQNLCWAVSVLIKLKICAGLSLCSTGINEICWCCCCWFQLLHCTSWTSFRACSLQTLNGNWGICAGWPGNMPPDGGWGCLMLMSCLGTQGWHVIPFFPSPLLFFFLPGPAALPHFSADGLMVQSPDFFPRWFSNVFH